MFNINKKNEEQIESKINSRNNDLCELIINLLFVSGDGMTIHKISDVIGEDKKIILDNLGEVKSKLRSVGLDLTDHEEKKNERVLQIVTGKNHNIQSLLYKSESIEELTPAQLQTLTLVAYLGEATNHEISFMRGVQSSMTLRLLTVRGFLIKSGNHYRLSVESLKHLGVTEQKELKDYENINQNLKNKLKDAINVD